VHRYYKDLVAMGLVRNRATLRNRTLNPPPNFPPFPAGRLIGPNARVWSDEELDAYVAACPVEPKATPRRRRRRLTKTE